eukprot:9897374-Prorocentrum_lima.AAC.1
MQQNEDGFAVQLQEKQASVNHENNVLSSRAKRQLPRVPCPESQPISHEGHTHALQSPFIDLLVILWRWR